MAATQTVKAKKRTTVSSSLFSGDAVNLAFLLVRNTDGDATKLKHAQETIQQAFSLVPDVLEDMKNDADAKVLKIKTKAERIGNDLNLVKSQFQQKGDEIKERMLNAYLAKGVPQDRAEELVNEQYRKTVTGIDKRMKQLKVQPKKEEPKRAVQNTSTANVARMTKNRPGNSITLQQTSKTFSI